MDSLSEKIYQKSPNFIQNLLITLYNYRAYSYRYNDNYHKYLREFRFNDKLNSHELEKIQLDRFKDFIKYAKAKSTYYDSVIPDNYVESVKSLNQIRKLPFLTKEKVRHNIEEIRTIPKSEAITAKTGGTTGISLEVYFTKEDVQRRSAHVDYHRSKRGYELGKKTAWFSGRKIITENDVSKERYWKSDFYHNVRYYSTFNISPDTVNAYLENLIKFKPEYFIGFPSSIYEIAKAGHLIGLKFPETVKAIFPNAETLSEEMRDTIEKFFQTKIFDQYGSSEGAPHIFEGEDGLYYHNPEVGILEVLDENNNPSQKGRLVVTPFFTKGTPLIRYEIGDFVEAVDGEEYPTAFKKIYGRSVDVIYSITNGKINSVNISNCSKAVNGLVKFKLIQNKMGFVQVKYVIDNDKFTEKDLSKFTSNLRDRLGHEMQINFKRVQDIPKEKSGKYRIIENNIDS